MISLKGLTAFITGASRGIGRSVAVKLAQEGCNLFLIGRDSAALQETLRLCTDRGAKSTFFICDITNNAQLQNAIEHCVQTFGGINILVNNAGWHGQTETLSDWEQAIAVNLLALIRCTKWCLPYLEKESLTKRCAIINIGSISGKLKIGSPGYCASKHGVDGFSGSLFEQVREKGIKVTEILPGFVNTEMASSPRLDAKKMIQPEDVAEVVAFAAKMPETACLSEIEIRPQRTPYLK
jgi:NADP-dependent 3-hydroxy acid dehydrogenase YdfG